MDSILTTQGVISKINELKGKANGLAPLNKDGKIPVEHLDSGKTWYLMSIGISGYPSPGNQLLDNPFIFVKSLNDDNIEPIRDAANEIKLGDTLCIYDVIFTVKIIDTYSCATGITYKKIYGIGYMPRLTYIILTEDHTSTGLGQHGYMSTYTIPYYSQLGGLTYNFDYSENPSIKEDNYCYTIQYFKPKENYRLIAAGDNINLADEFLGKVTEIGIWAPPGTSFTSAAVFKGELTKPTLGHFELKATGYNTDFIGTIWQYGTKNELTTIFQLKNEPVIITINNGLSTSTEQHMKVQCVLSKSLSDIKVNDCIQVNITDTVLMAGIVSMKNNDGCIGYIIWDGVLCTFQITTYDSSSFLLELFTYTNSEELYQKFSAKPKSFNVLLGNMHEIETPGVCTYDCTISDLTCIPEIGNIMNIINGSIITPVTIDYAYCRDGVSSYSGVYQSGNKIILQQNNDTYTIDIVSFMLTPNAEETYLKKDDYNPIKFVTSEEYEALTDKSPNTLYIITDATN